MKTNTMALLGAGAVALLLGGRKVVEIKSTNENEQKYRPLIDKAEADFGIPKGLLYRLIRQESAFRADVITGARKSSAGALGIAQFMPATARQELGSEAAALSPEKAIPGAARYLKKLHASAGSWKSAVAAYNWGIGNVTKKGLAAAPAETKNYVLKVYGESIA